MTMLAVTVVDFLFVCLFVSNENLVAMAEARTATRQGDCG
jgi:hypothetical protein